MTAYATGTITLTNGSRAVTGDGTGWATALIAGGVIYPQAAGNPLPIASVDSDTAITAATEWVGATGTYAYALQRQDDANQVIANAAALADYIRRLDNEMLSALAGLTPAADKLVYFSGSSTAALTTLTAYARSLMAVGDEGAALTELGVTAFMQTLLNDPDAGTARQTLGASPAIPGQVGMFAMSAAPTGWLKADGATLSRVTYVDLFNAIGTTFGAGDGSSTFKLPDLRGAFLRGWADGGGVDSGRSLGSAQAQNLPNFQKRLPIGFDASEAYFWSDGSNNPVFGSEVVSTNGRSSAIGGGSGSRRVAYSDPANINVTGELRPRNVALLACIKY